MLSPETDSWDRLHPHESRMMISNVYLMIFAVAMTGCVLATPLVTWIATLGRRDRSARPVPADPQGRDARLGGLAPGPRRGGRRRS